MKIVFMVGNGLDLHLGLKTRYSDFYSWHKEHYPDVHNQIFDAIDKDKADWADYEGSGANFTQGECILYHELKLEVFR
ncbi:AbiH family protein [Lacticaseibacillus paracasei]|uniref:AbiH family protein n=1 Tax=Lacticaseibacillus paracasei TaxID=1597 RepID=UPI002ADECE37|nr:AbiH family protein [Lacticaseibacillus paracasei]MEA1056746.1 AbiH family protein [Lacticaseibacillus paracasei]